MLHEINLLNWRQQQQRLKHRRWLGCVTFGVVIFVLFQGLLFWSVQNQQHFLGEVQMKRQQQHSILEVEEQRWLSQQAQSHQVEHRLMQLKHWERLNRLPYQLMRLLSESTPEGVYFETLDLREQEVSVQGIGQDASRISLLIQQLKHHPCSCIRELKMMSVIRDGAHRDIQWQSFQLSFFVVVEAGAKA